METYLEQLLLNRSKQQKAVKEGILKSLQYQAKEIDILIKTVHLVNSIDDKELLDLFKRYKTFNELVISSFIELIKI